MVLVLRSYYSGNKHSCRYTLRLFSMLCAYEILRRQLGIWYHIKQQLRHEPPRYSSKDDIEALTLVPLKNNKEFVDHHHSSHRHNDKDHNDTPLSMPYHGVMQQGNDDKRLQSDKQHDEVFTEENKQVLSRHPPPRWVFGHSTGHAGSTTAHEYLTRQDGTCPFHITGAFERTIRKRAYGSCKEVQDKLVPFLLKQRNNNNKKKQKDNDENSRSNKNVTTYMDLGHFHNRGRVIECFAELLSSQHVHFIHLRRNRYHIAHSFAHDFDTPCLYHYYYHHDNDNTTTATNNDTRGRQEQRHGRHSHHDRTSRGHHHRHPVVAICPHSKELEKNGPVNLVVDDATWDRLTSFQKFLWYADEMEYKWYTLQRDYPLAKYFEITWTTGDELHAGLQHIREVGWGCSPLSSSSFAGEQKQATILPNIKQHVQHVKKSRNCSDYIRQDLEYKTLMKFDNETRKILFGRHIPQRVDFDDCMDSVSELQDALRRGGVIMGDGSWKLPSSPK